MISRCCCGAFFEDTGSLLLHLGTLECPLLETGIPFSSLQQLEPALLEDLRDLYQIAVGQRRRVRGSPRRKPLSDDTIRGLQLTLTLLFLRSPPNKPPVSMFFWRVLSKVTPVGGARASSSGIAVWLKASDLAGRFLRIETNSDHIFRNKTTLGIVRAGLLNLKFLDRSCSKASERKLVALLACRPSEIHWTVTERLRESLCWRSSSKQRVLNRLIRKLERQEGRLKITDTLEWLICDLALNVHELNVFSLVRNYRTGHFQDTSQLGPALTMLCALGVECPWLCRSVYDHEHSMWAGALLNLLTRMKKTWPFDILYLVMDYALAIELPGVWPLGAESVERTLETCKGLRRLMMSLQMCVPVMS